MSKRVNIRSNTLWEEQVCYSRAVRVGNMIEVAGTTAVDEMILSVKEILINRHNLYSKKLKLLSWKQVAQ